MSANEIRIFAKEPTKLLIGEREIIIRPIPLRQYVKVYPQVIDVAMKALEYCPDIDVDNFQPVDLLKMQPILPEIVGLLGSILGISKNVLLEYDLYVLTEIINAVFDVNNISLVIENFEKARAQVKPHVKQKASPKTTGALAT